MSHNLTVQSKTYTQETFGQSSLHASNFSPTSKYHITDPNIAQYIKFYRIVDVLYTSLVNTLY